MTKVKRRICLKSTCMKTCRAFDANASVRDLVIGEERKVMC